MGDYAVGAAYVPGIEQWAPGSDFLCRGDTYELRLFLTRPSRGQVQTLRRGRCEFAVAAFAQDLAFLYRFGQELPWAHAFYSWRCLPPEERIVPLPIDQEPTRLEILLVDASTGTIRATRTVVLSLFTSGYLYRAIRNQMDRTARDESSLDTGLTVSDLLGRATAACEGRDIEAPADRRSEEEK